MADSAAELTGRIFISYRRDETAYPAGWLFDRLVQHFGTAQIFKDVDSIELGDDFVEVITRAVGSCDVLLALIGDQWLTVTDVNGQRRIDDPADFVRLEIQAALTRNVLIIPILVNGAKMPRAEELPAGLAGLARRQALELSPNRFEYDTHRLLRVLDGTLAEVRMAGASTTLTREPTAQPSYESPSAPSTTPAADERGPTKNVSFFGRRQNVRLLMLIGGPLATLLAVYVIIQLVFLNKPAAPHENNSAQLSASSEIKQEGPWRLVVRNDGTAADGCTITLVNSDTNETWSNMYPVYETASFLISQAGTFRWSAESGCTVVSRSGSGNLTLPAVVDGVGTSDAFKPPATITVRVKDFHGNQRCNLQLRDVAAGTIVDIGELNKQTDSVTLQTEGRPQVYLVNDACAVQVSPG
jgi:TIR domain-containing protein